MLRHGVLGPRESKGVLGDPGGSKKCSGHKAQGSEPGEMSSPSHHLMGLLGVEQQKAMQKHAEETHTQEKILFSRRALGEKRAMWLAADKKKL